MANLNIKVTADTTQAQANLNAFANQFKKMQGDTNRLASQMGSLSGNVNSFAQALGQTTPRTLELARAYEKLVSNFQNGNISLNQARTAIDSIQKELAELEAASKRGGDGAQSFSLKWTELKSQLDLAVGTFRAVAEGAEAAFDFAELGAQVKQMDASFALLIENVGAAPDLFDQLKAAAGGTIPDLTLMSSTAKLLAGTSGELAEAMASAAPRLLEVARAAVKLDPTLGSVEEVFQSLATGIKRNSPLLIDNANITLKLGTANETLAAQLGKSVEEFTDAERAMAVLNATLEGGDKLIQQVGGTVESETDKFARLTTALTNLKNAGAVLATDFLSPTVIGLGEVAAAAAEGEGVLTTYLNAIDTFNLSVATGIGDFFGGLATDIENIVARLLGLQPPVEQASTAFHNLSDAQLEHAAAQEKAVTGYDALGEGMSNLEDFYANQHLRLEESIEDFKAQAEAEAAAAAEMQKWNAAAAQAIETAQDAAPKIQELNDVLNQDVGSPLASFIDDINFFLASGGRDFVSEFEAIQQTLAEKIAAEDTTPGQAALAMYDAKIAAGELLADFLNLQVELGKETPIGAAESLSEHLGVSVGEAKLLLADFDQNADEVLGEEREILLETTSLDDLHLKVIEAEGDLTTLGDFEVKPKFEPEGLEETKDEVVATNEAALLAEESIGLMVEATGAAPEGAENLAPLSLGLGAIEASAIRAETAIRRMLQAASQADLDALDPFIAHSPPPLGAGLDYIAGAIPAVVAGLNALNLAMYNSPNGDTPALPGLEPSGVGAQNMHTLFEILIRDAEDYADALFDAASAFGGLADKAADLFEEQTLDPLKEALKGIDDQIAALLESETVDMYELSRLTGERAEKAAEIAEQEERILRLQEQQQKLDFLKQQFELIQFLQENGLDPAAFLGGVGLGANADPAALIDAMAAALEQILAQLSGQLSGLGFAGGADFVVPPGYPGDSFGPMWATSGEHVTVTRPGENAGGMTVQVNLAGAIIMSQQEADRLMRTALDRAGAQADIYRRGGR